MRGSPDEGCPGQGERPASHLRLERSPSPTGHPALPEMGMGFAELTQTFVGHDGPVDPEERDRESVHGEKVFHPTLGGCEPTDEAGLPPVVRVVAREED